MQVPKFSDFADEVLDTKKAIRSRKDLIDINDVVGKNIIVKSFLTSKSKNPYNEVIIFCFDLNNISYKIRTISITLKRQICKYADKIPFETKIIKGQLPPTKVGGME